MAIPSDKPSRAQAETSHSGRISHVVGFDDAPFERSHRGDVLVVARYLPDLQAIRKALLEQVPGGARKWRLIEAAGAMEPMAALYVQRCGITAENAARLFAGLQQNSQLPEPLRAARMIAGGVTTGESRHRA